MTTSIRLFIFLAGLMGAEAVIAGAVSAHADLDSAAIALVERAAQYEIWHALALLGVTLWMQQAKSRLLFASAVFLTLGVILFCGTLYVKGFWAIPLFPMSAPIGGSCLILGWLSLALAAWRMR